MGLNIKDIVIRKELDVKELSKKTVCVDAFNMLYQFLSTVRQIDGTPLMDNQKRITSHLSGIFYRNVSLISNGIKLIYVLYDNGFYFSFSFLFWGWSYRRFI